MALTGKQFRELSEALSEAFPTYDILRIFLRTEMDLSLENISNPDAMPVVLYEVLQYTDATNRTENLVEAARRARPENAGLIAIAQELHVLPQTDNLERILNNENIIFDVAVFRNKVAEIESRVCRVEINGNAAGTGFLVGPSAVMTNYHVVKAVIEGSVSPDNVRLRFDYKLLEDGTTINSGVIHKLAADWLIDESSYSDVDMQPEPKQGSPAPDELDYAILRTEESASEDSLSNVPMPEFYHPRGFVELPAVGSSHDFATNKVLFIVQHPLGSPLKLTANIYRSTNSNNTRVTYLNDTESGSSGSACFSANWDLVALHHSGDPDYKQPEYNEGIPITAIVNLLQERNKLQEILPPE